jgi:hypothetical protein
MLPIDRGVGQCPFGAIALEQAGYARSAISGIEVGQHGIHDQVGYVEPSQFGVE